MSVDQFKNLHDHSNPFIVGNVWDAHSAQLAEKAGFKGLGTSSHAIANALGYEDGEHISVDEILFVVERIVKAVKIPVSVDFEAGYSSDPEEVASYVKQLTDIGVVGINIEDGVVVDGERKMEDPKILAHKIKAIKAVTKIFVNARADTYTTKADDALNESIRRARIYAEAGADGIFVPLIDKEEDIKAFLDEISLPLNVFVTPDLPDYEKLGSMGVKRISYGATWYDKLVKKTADFFKTINDKKSFDALL